MGRPNPHQPGGHLPRLDAEHYRGRSIVFWTHTVEGRATGWLDDRRHAQFRELLLHAATREQILCPIYTMMPDHIHLLWMGVADDADQRLASSFVRTRFEKVIAPHVFQHQPYDHVLREDERESAAFSAVCAYIAQNPMRKELSSSADAWAFTGSVVPGYPDLRPTDPEFWDLFWKIYNRCVERGRLGKL